MINLYELVKKENVINVEFMQLYEIFDQFSGMSGVTNKWSEEGNCLFIDYMNVYKNLKVDVSVLNKATVKNINQNTLKKGDILFTSASETPHECAIVSEIEDEVLEGILLDDHLFGLRVKKEFKDYVAKGFLKHVFSSADFRLQVNKVVRGVTRFYISKTDFMKLKIPIPSIELQQEIVHILDNFAELTAELTAELAARKQQYEYYRNYLFTFDKNIATVSLGSVSEISRGVRVVKKQLNADGEYPVYQNSLAPMGYYDKYNCDANTTYIISAGAAGEIGFCDKNFWAADDCFMLSNLNGLINKFIYYFLMTKQDFIRSQVRRASIPRLSRSVIENLEIPLIHLEEQQRIVDILDKFDKLVNDISEGIPAEIAARQKQYEYYRDKLLTFKEVGNESI